MVSSVAMLGPFVGGLNKSSDASAIADNEVSECVNFNVDIDGSLVCRQPITQVPLTSSIVYTGHILAIGSVNIAGIPYIIGSTDAGVYAFKVSTTDADGLEMMDPILISSTLKSDCAIQLHGVVMILATPDSVGVGGIWNGTTFVTDVNMPKGSSALFFKGRVFVAPGAFELTEPKSSQLLFSDPVPITLPVTIPWNPVNLIPVGQGDGQNLIDMIVMADNLMLFKNNSTYALAYDVNPNEAILRKVNSNIGVSAQFCVLTHENAAYVYHEGKVYQISNYTFLETNIKLPFKANAVETTRREKVCLSLVGNTIVVRYFDNMYALNLVTKTWSEWISSNSNLNNLGRVLKLETNLINSQLEGYYGGSVAISQRMFRIHEKHTETDTEVTWDLIPMFGPDNFPFDYWGKVEHDIDCYLTTKIYDFGTPMAFKRLMWWGVDLISDGHIIALASPVTQTGPVTWGDLSSHTWGSLNLWNNLLGTIGYAETDVNDPYVIRRKFMKLLKSLRFRQISFTVKLSSKGNTAEGQTLGPSRVFSLSAIVGVKQTVVKQVS